MEDYKGFRIVFNEGNDVWEAKNNEGELSDVSLKLLKEKIDKTSKKKFKRFKVFVDRAKIELEEVTSIGNDGRLWLVNKEGDREKHWNSNSVYFYNKKNMILVEKINAMYKEEQKIAKERIKIERELEVFKTEKKDEE